MIRVRPASLSACAFFSSPTPFVVMEMGSRGWRARSLAMISHEVRPDQRLSACEAEFPDAKALDADAHDSLDLTGRHDGLLR